MTERLLLGNYLKTLKLPTMLREYEAVARQCAQACPTGALVLRTETCERADICKTCPNTGARDKDD